MNNDYEIDALLTRLRQNNLPSVPDLRRQVRDEIVRLKAHPSFWRQVLPILNWNELFRQPRIAVSALALALVVGVVPGFISAKAPHRSADAEIARASLHLHVFHSDWNNLSSANR
jgi:hypothetical protein